MCRQWHPDTLKDYAAGSRKINDINAAYRLLLDYCKTADFLSARKRWNLRPSEVVVPAVWEEYLHLIR
jgi:hypothetical protein